MGLKSKIAAVGAATLVTGPIGGGAVAAGLLIRGAYKSHKEKKQRDRNQDGAQSQVFLYFSFFAAAD
jgi:Na+/glutamate symporter